MSAEIRWLKLIGLHAKRLHRSVLGRRVAHNFLGGMDLSCRRAFWS